MKICIDAGHNYSLYDTGAVGNGLREQDITFNIADKLKDLFKTVGIEVVMTRPDIRTNVGKNADDSIIQRYKIANNNKCDYFISIHCNSYENHSANGTETLIVGKGGEAEKLAEKVNSEIVKTLNTSDRGIKVRGDLGVLKYTDMPAILVECAFISNTKDAQMLRDKQTEFATAIFNGFCNYSGIEKKIKIETANDITYVLKCKYGIKFNTINNEKAFINELDEAKKKDSKLYWVYYKLVN